MGCLISRRARALSSIRECNLVITAGSFYQTDDQINCGGHTQRFAYYASLNGNRSNYGLQTPIPQTVNDAENGYGGFASFIYNHDPKNQFRIVTSLRQDYFQIPVDPNPNSQGNQILEASGEVPSYGLHDAEREPDGYVIFSWAHTFDPTTLLTLSPFYHYNAAHYEGGADDYPVITNADQARQLRGTADRSEQDFLAGIVWRREYMVFSSISTATSTIPIPMALRTFRHPPLASMADWPLNTSATASTRRNG